MRNTIIRVPFKHLNTIQPLIINFQALILRNLFSKHYNVDFYYRICHNNNKIYYYRWKKDMMYKYSIRIPYNQRNKYKTILKQINSLVSIDGMFSIFVNNIPYSLDCIVCIHTDKNHLEIEKIITNNSLVLVKDKGFDELMEDIPNRSWNFSAINTNNDLFDCAFDRLFLFKDSDSLKKDGMTKPTHTKKKVFISYCHNDIIVVDNVVSTMKRMGLNYWIDKEDLLSGDSIIQTINQALNECDMFVLFISTETLKSNYAKYELLTALSSLITTNKKWFLVRIDDVIPNDITFGLSNYLYYQYDENSVETLVNSISKKMLKDT